MNITRTLKAGVVAAVFAASLIALAGPASATADPWVVAGDSNGALGNCDPGELSTTINEGLSWATQPAFQPTNSPCALGGRINSLDAVAGRVFAAGYRNTATGLRQGIILQSLNQGSSWSVLRLIPAGATNTEFTDISADLGGAALYVNAVANSADQTVTGRFYMNTWSWQPYAILAGSDISGIEVHAVDSRYGDGTYAASVDSTTGHRCGMLATTVSGFLEVSSAQACLPGHDVRLNGIDIRYAQGQVHSRLVGSAAAPGQLSKPIAVHYTGLFTTSTQVLPGSGGLNAVERNAAGVMVAVGFQRVNGTKAASIFRSTDLGATWTQVTAPAGAKPLNDVAYLQDEWVAVGDGGTLLRSVDGISWTNGLAPSTKTLRSITQNS